ncbi:MAG: nucleotidyltransferase domain-containing protein [Nanoarchaeota archaeon]
MVGNVNSILKEVLQNISPNKTELEEIKIKLAVFLKELETNKKRLRIDAQIFVGGSFAKNTIIKKDRYDIDIFVRFDKKYLKQNLSDLTEKIIGKVKGKNKVERIHGSRDYFKIVVGKNLFFEIVPVLKINHPKEAENVTDLSYFHVNYAKKKIKGKVLDEIKIAKAFCHATGCYGAESYIKGFSGYALELLIYHYKSFQSFVKAMTKVNEKSKLIIDTEKHYKKKNQILMDVNGAKLGSPIILIDPTYKQRNIIAALSEETFKKFQKDCKNFLKRPSIEAFETKKTDTEKIRQEAKKKNLDFVLLEATTNKQEGDVAGSKLLKFYHHLTDETKRYFQIKNLGFEYNQGKNARYFFVVKSKKEVIARGPEVKDKKNVDKFKASHKKTFVKNGRVYAQDKIDFKLKDFIVRWKNSNMDRIKEMYIVGLKVF